jgi:hypothetical protein
MMMTRRGLSTMASLSRRVHASIRSPRDIGYCRLR